MSALDELIWPKPKSQYEYDETNINNYNYYDGSSSANSSHKSDINSNGSSFNYHYHYGSVNDTLEDRYTECKGMRAPTAEVLIKNLPTSGYVLFGILSLFTLLNLLMYLEEILFLLRTFSITLRRKKTIWVLAFYPMFSVCGLLGCFIPRCATLVDLIANLYFATCLYNFGRLIINYLGGSSRVWTLVGETPRMVDFRTLPVCCCCLCLPKKKLTKGVFFRINLQIMQVAIVRPLAHFVAAVLWTNESYVQGEMKINRAFLYITIINVSSTLLAVYGLMLLRRIFSPELERKFKIGGKIASIQLCLIASIIPSLVLNSLVVNGKIPCTKLLSPKTVGEEILHMSWILMMLPFGLMARTFFRRREDAIGYAEKQTPTETGSKKAELICDNDGGGGEDDEDEEEKHVDDHQLPFVIVE